VWPKLKEAALADAAHRQKVLGAAEGAETLPVLDDAPGQRRPDARQTLKLFARSAVDGETRAGRVGGRRGGNFDAPDMRAAWQFDAG